MNTPATLGTIVARAILSGDVSRAHAEAGGRTTWTPAEAWAISAACRVARQRFAGCAVSLADFMGSPVAPKRRPARVRGLGTSAAGAARLRELSAHMAVCRAVRCKVCR